MKKRIYKEDNGFCYDILTDGDDLLIHQDGKPAVGGTNGFATKAEAANIANLVIALMDADLSPSVTVAQVTNAKNINIAEEIKAIEAAIEKAKDAPKPKNLQ
jgi:hypothetical protein